MLSFMADVSFCVAKLLFDDVSSDDSVVGFALATDGALPSPGNKCNRLSPDIVERECLAARVR